MESEFLTILKIGTDCSIFLRIPIFFLKKKQHRSKHSEHSDDHSQNKNNNREDNSSDNRNTVDPTVVQ